MATKKQASIHVEALQTSIANYEELGEEYLENAVTMVGQVFKSKAMGPQHQAVYSPVLDALNVPVKFDFTPEAYGYYSAQHTASDPASSLTNEHINISATFYEVLKNPSKYGVNYPIQELIFVYVHELYHARFKHITKHKILSETYPFPMSVYNVIFDIFINTLLRYDTNIVNRVGGNIKNLQMFKYCMRYYDSTEELKEMMPVVASRLEERGVTDFTMEELIAAKVLGREEIERMSDVELAQLLYELFKDFFDDFQELFDETVAQMEQGSSQGDGEGKGDNADNSDNADGSDGDEDSDEGKGSGEGGGEDDSDSDSEGKGEDKGRDEAREFTKAFDENLKKKAQSDPKFAKNLKRWLANFADLPSVQSQYVMHNNAKGGVMKPSEIADMLRAKRSLADVVQNIEEKNAGTMPGFLRSFAEVEPKKASYLAQLQSFGNRHIGDTRKTFSPPNKKHSRGNLLIPSRVGSTLDLAFIIDTSGSMSNNEIMPVLGQINAVLRRAPSSSKLHVLFNDASFQHEVIRGRNVAKFKKILAGGVQGAGGSVFGDVFKHKSIKQVDAIIFLSDFYIYVPDDLNLKVPLVCLHTEDYNKNVMDEIMSRARYSLAVPAGRLD